MIDVRQAIIRSLNNKFGIKVYGEMTEQNFETPCFYVKTLLADHTKQVGNYQRSFYSFNIHYFPNDEDNRPNKACNDMKAELNGLFFFFEELKLFPVKLTGEVVNSVLHFIVDFNIRYKVEIDDGSEKLRELEMRSEVVDG